MFSSVDFPQLILKAQSCPKIGEVIIVPANGYGRLNKSFQPF